MRNARAPPRSMFSCCFTAFDAFSREDLGHFSGHFSVVTFSRSNLGTFFEACGHIFSFKFRIFFSSVASTFSRQFSEYKLQLWTPPKHGFGKVLGYGGPQKMFPWKRFSWIFVGNCHVLQQKIVACKFRRYGHHTHVLVTTRKGSRQAR